MPTPSRIHARHVHPLRGRCPQRRPQRGLRCGADPSRHAWPCRQTGQGPVGAPENSQCCYRYIHTGLRLSNAEAERVR